MGIKKFKVITFIELLEGLIAKRKFELDTKKMSDSDRINYKKLIDHLQLKLSLAKKENRDYIK